MLACNCELVLILVHSLITTDAVMEDSCMRRTIRPPCKRAKPWHLVLTGSGSVRDMWSWPDQAD
jgi:hypothetical protein